MKKSFDPKSKYRRYEPIELKDRNWPNQVISKAPAWCSVDLRDGNQALINPMSKQQKLKFFKLLLDLGFKEIEIGFPSAAKVEFDFARVLIEKQLIPDDVIPQVLTQAREHLIRRTFQALEGAKKAILHIYNSTSEMQRRIVFNKSRNEILDIAVQGVELVKKLSKETDTQIQLEYSPESFTNTELDFAKEICEAVMDAWGPTPDNKIILNLPATVEYATPNVHADQIEWMHRNLKNRSSIILSLHPHNDRGTGIAAAELGLLAGADRVEGTLFGNGERTGNVDLITLALNLYTHGIDPELDLRNLEAIKMLSEECTELGIPPRHPYAGDLVFTAFSGSHQDAIRKGMDAQKNEKKEIWEVPYLPIDPSDIGRGYQAIIRINSQSGKGGVAFIMEEEFGYRLPKMMHPELSIIIQDISDKKGKEISSLEIWEAFEKEYLDANSIIEYKDFWIRHIEDKSDQIECTILVKINGKEQELKGIGNGPIDSCKAALINGGITEFKLLDYSEHALGIGSDSKAVAYIQLKNKAGDKIKWGAGVDSNINKASIKALLSAINRLG